MRIGCVYINAGKGHYIPAKAIKDALEDHGVDVELLNFFQMIQAPRFDVLNSRVWRWQLKHPAIEQKINGHVDNASASHKVVPKILAAQYRKNFQQWMRDNPFDAFICTHYLASMMLPELLEKTSNTCPVFAYASDVFTTVRSGLHPKLASLFISTSEGVDEVMAKGFPKNKIKLTAFPLQRACWEADVQSKNEARKKLGYPHMFTVLINLGGEGIGTVAIIEELERQELSLQVILVGGMSDQELASFQALKKRSHFVQLHPVGFVDTIYDYLYACDLVVGKAGINAMVEAIYVKRPFIVTTVYYTVKAAADYVEKYGIGWYAPKTIDQVAIIARYLHEPTKLEALDQAFSRVPITFGASDIAQHVIQMVQEGK